MSTPTPTPTPAQAEKPAPTGNPKWGYPSTLPCAVCGAKAQSNQAEPRYLYTVCMDHQKVPPNLIPE